MPIEFRELKLADSLASFHDTAEPFLTSGTRGAAVDGAHRHIEDGCR